MTATQAETVLVVDDSATSRTKLAAAVRNLGLQVLTAASGQEALACLAETPCDAILLDIVMPGMDGFAVLDRLKAEDALRDIPVIVISALDDDTDSVVRAIELGAEEFLPKDFDAVILRARLNASLQKKRFRDKELEYLDLVDQMTQAAEILETAEFEPSSLKIDHIAARSDPLGRLAKVFQGMAEEIYVREVTLRRNVRMLRGVILVLAVGAVWGIIAPLSRMAAGLETSPLGLAIWANIVGASVCLTVAAVRGTVPRLTWTVMRFCLFWSILGGILQQLVLYWVTGHVEASTVSLIVTFEGFMVFGVTALLGLEKASGKRLLGLGIGLAGAVLVILTRADVGSGAGLIWLLAAMLVPALFAIEDILLAARRPAGLDIIASTGIMMAISLLLVTPLAFAFDGFLPLGPAIGRLEIVVALIGLAHALATVLILYLVTVAGAVFASQAGYSSTIAGILWSMLLLDERLSVLAWLALALMIFGLYLVEPQTSDEDLQFKLPFGRRSARRSDKAFGSEAS